MIVVPARFRRKFGIEEGTLIIAEEREDGILIRPAAAYPIEIYTPQRKAEFILSSAVDEADYQAACETVRQMGLDPNRIEHYHPTRSWAFLFSGMEHKPVTPANSSEAADGSLFFEGGVPLRVATAQCPPLPCGRGSVRHCGTALDDELLSKMSYNRHRRRGGQCRNG